MCAAWVACLIRAISYKDVTDLQRVCPTPGNQSTPQRIIILAFRSIAAIDPGRHAYPWPGPDPSSPVLAVEPEHARAQTGTEAAPVDLHRAALRPD